MSEDARELDEITRYDADTPDPIGYFLFGLFIGGLCVGLWLTGDIKTAQKARTAVYECEAELPRNEKCVITAVVERKKGS